MRMGWCNFQPDDTGKGLTLQGPLAGLVRTAAYRQPMDQHKLCVGSHWLQQVAEETQHSACCLVPTQPGDDESSPSIVLLNQLFRVCSANAEFNTP